MTKQRDVTRPPCQGFEPVDGHPDISLVAEAVDIGAYVFEPGYYFGTPYMDLEGPFGTLNEAMRVAKRSCVKAQPRKEP